MWLTTNDYPLKRAVSVKSSIQGVFQLFLMIIFALIKNDFVRSAPRASRNDFVHCKAHEKFQLLTGHSFNFWIVKTNRWKPFDYLTGIKVKIARQKIGFWVWHFISMTSFLYKRTWWHIRRTAYICITYVSKHYLYVKILLQKAEKLTSLPKYRNYNTNPW